jgi:hypothetical protein
MLNDNNIAISNCRCQSCDNANNMSRIYPGVKARFHEINTFGEWVPYAAHCLNLVESVTIECCTKAI